MIRSEIKVNDLLNIPGVGKSIARDLRNIGITSINDLRGKSPQTLYDMSNAFAGVQQDRCLLYVFRCAVYFADTRTKRLEPEKLKWWNWKDEHKSKRLKKINGKK